MAQDVRKLFDNDPKKDAEAMPAGHETRFLNKLDQKYPFNSDLSRANEIKKRFSLMYIAASIVVLLGLTFGAYQMLQQPAEVIPEQNNAVAMKSLGDISPDLKKVEDYYMANINLELANVKLTPDNKELFDSYIVRLEELNKEYQRLSQELTDLGPNELTVSALIDNLKLRLNLLYRLKEQLQQLNISANDQNVT